MGSNINITIADNQLTVQLVSQSITAPVVQNAVSAQISEGTPIQASIVNNQIQVTITGGGITDLSSFDTDDLSEGSVNLYYTDGRVENVINTELQDGESIDDAIDSLIATHAGVSDAHHSRYTDAEAIAAILPIDISDDTNLEVTSPITLTDDTIGFDFSTNNTWTGTNLFQPDTNSVTALQVQQKDGTPVLTVDTDTPLVITNVKLDPSNGGMLSPYTNSVVVDTGGLGDYTTVQDAIDGEGSNTVINVNQGTFDENIDFASYTNITVRGSGIGVTVLRNTAQNARHIDSSSATNINIIDCTIQYSIIGNASSQWTPLNFSATTTITNCTITNGGFTSNFATNRRGTYMGCSIAGASTGSFASGAIFLASQLTGVFNAPGSNNQVVAVGARLTSGVHTSTVDFYSGCHITPALGFAAQVNGSKRASIYNSSVTGTSQNVSTNTGMALTDSYIATLNMFTNSNTSTGGFDLRGCQVNTLGCNDGSGNINIWGNMAFNAFTGTVGASQIVVHPNYAPKYLKTISADYYALKLEANTAAATPFILKGAASQSATLLEIQNSSAAVTLSAKGFDSTTAFQINKEDTTVVFNVDTTNVRVGIGTDTLDSALHIKAGIPGTVGSHTAGQLIIQNPTDSVFSNAVITGYESDGSGNPDQQLWYLGSSSTGNTDIIFLNRRNAKLALGTNGTSRITILGNGNVGVNVTDPDTKLEILNAGNQLKLSFDGTDNAVFAVDTNGDLTITPSGTSILIPSKLAFTQVDLNEYIDSLNDGYMDYRATTAHRFGDGTNQLVISNAGVLTLEGTAKRWLAVRPDLDYTVITAQGKPTQVVVGVFHGYSMPVYIGGQNEELFFNLNVPGRWDEASDIIVHMLVALSGAEDIGDYFKFQLSWEHLSEEDAIPVTSHDVEVEQAVLAGRTAQYSTYELIFTLDYDVDDPDNVIDHDDLAMRLRRIDATNPDITNEIIVLDYHVEFQVDKMFDAVAK